MFCELLLFGGLAAAAPALTAPKAAKLQNLGMQTTTNGHIGRDLGWTGKVGNTILATYGDTHTCGLSPSSLVDDTGCAVPSASNSVARVSADDPTKVYEFPAYLDGGVVKQFCAAEADEPDSNGQFAIGITQVQQVSEDESMLFFLINNRTDSDNPMIEGAGIAKITMDGGVPKCDRVKNAVGTGSAANYFWDGTSEPNYGAYASMSGQDGYIFGYGTMAKASGLSTPVFANRVPEAEYKDINSYEYWNGKSWQKQRLHNPDANASVMQSTGQGSAHYSKWLDSYLMMSMNGASSGLSARVAKKPEGPWSDPVTLMKGGCADGYCSYGGAMMPWYDPTGKSTVVSYTPVGSSTEITVMNVTWA